MLKSIDEPCARDVRIGLAPSKLEWPPGSAMSHTSSPLAKSSPLTFIGGDGARNDDYDRKALLAQADQSLAILLLDEEYNNC